LPFSLCQFFAAIFFIAATCCRRCFIIDMRLLPAPFFAFRTAEASAFADADATCCHYAARDDIADFDDIFFRCLRQRDAVIITFIFAADDAMPR
jgi:hypothetical protein